MNNEPSSDIEAIYEQLIREVGTLGQPLDLDGRDAHIAHLGRQAIVCAGSPDSGGRPVGAFGRKIRGTVFRLTRFYVDPLVKQQRSFNLALVRHIAELERRIAELEGERPSGGR